MVEGKTAVQFMPVKSEPGKLGWSTAESLEPAWATE